MALTFADLQTEVLARGFSDMTSTADTTRIKRWINDAAHEIDGQADWPYRQVTTTGPAPLTITDLGTIEAVTDVAGQRTLRPTSRRDLRRWFGNLTTAGAPVYYYIVGGTQLLVYPTSSSLTLTVDYWKVAADMVAATDTPLMPDRYRMAIVDYAVARASRDRGDLAGAQDARAAGDQLIALMANEQMMLQHQQTQDFIEMVGDDC